jgi:heme/copper-type cytochrome/quinol oxidase subunit 3
MDLRPATLRRVRVVSDLFRVKLPSLVSVGEGTEAERDALQKRLQLLCTTFCAVSFCFSVVVPVILTSTGASSLNDHFAQWTTQLHHAVNLLLLTAALVFRFARFQTRTLRVADPVFVLVVTWLFGIMFAKSPAVNRPELSAALATMTICVFRAVLIPSTAMRSFLITSLGAAPCIMVAWLAHRDTSYLQVPGVHLTHVGITLLTLLWWMVQVVIATLTTTIIYGLEQRVREARHFGQYLLEEKLGEGGMGVVYRASHALLRRPTAIKLLAKENVGENALQRFAREVRLTARLTHPNTVTIYDYGRTPEGLFYYAMELLDGIDLEELVRANGPLPAARVRHILVQIGQALGEAHAIGLIHRDIKPANIMLCKQIGRSDVAKLLDFGLVRDLEGPDKTHSGSTAFLGTPLYMAPESIVDPGGIDARADIYALAAVGYFLLVGAPVFQGRSVVEVCGHHLHSEPVPPSARTSNVIPANFEALLLRCLAKRAADRVGSADQLVEELTQLWDLPGWTQREALGWWQDHDRLASEPVNDHATTGARRKIPEATNVPALTVDINAR